MKGGFALGFFVALFLLAIGIIIGVAVVTIKCPLTHETGFKAFWTLVTTLGKGCGI